MNTLMAASRQWAIRPEDERFGSLQEMYLHALMAATQSRQQSTPPDNLRVNVRDGDLVLNTAEGDMEFNHWSFGQLFSRAGAPVGHMRDMCGENCTDISLDLAARIGNHYLSRMPADDDFQVYFRRHPQHQLPQLRAITSTKYGRIYNHEVIQALLNLGGNWRTPPAMPAKAGQKGTRIATAEDVGPWTNVEIGQEIAPAGLYASDKDMFAFLIDPERRIEDGSDQGLSRGFFCWNSEVGDATFGIQTFMFRYVCQNHIVWDASEVKKLKVKHLGRGAKSRAMDRLIPTLRAYSESSAAEATERIKAAKALVLGKDYDEVEELVFRQKKLLTQKQADAAWAAAEAHSSVDGAPNTAWGFSQGITRMSQDVRNADERVKLDYAAGKIISLAV